MTWWAVLGALGATNASGVAYLLLSGFVSDLGEFVQAIIVAVIGLAVALHLNCHEPGCRRIGRYHVAGGRWRVCGRHHPDGPPVPGQIEQDHRNGALRDDAHHH